MYFRIIQRQISEAEAKLLIQRIKNTPNIMGYSLNEWLKAQNLMVAEDEYGNLAGVCLNYVLDEKWHKIAALFVLDEYRGIGIGKSLFYKSVETALETEKYIYTNSANPIVIKMMDALGFFKFDSLANFPKEYSPDKLLIYSHSLKWVLNPYRVREIIRKKLVYGLREPFVYGIKS
jgi:GNAT superfamily N-acetyltransferase